MVKNFREVIFIRFGATHERDRRTDRRTPHAGNSHAMHSIARQKPGNPEFFQNRKTGFWLPVNLWFFDFEFWLTNVSLRDNTNSNSMQCPRFNVPFRLCIPLAGQPCRVHTPLVSHSNDIALLLLTRSAGMCTVYQLVTPASLATWLKLTELLTVTDSWCLDLWLTAYRFNSLQFEH